MSIEELKRYKLIREVKWEEVENIISSNPSYRSIYLDHPFGADRLSQLKIALTIVYEYGYSSASLLMRRLHIGETSSFSLMDFMWDQNIIEKEGEEPTYLGF